MKSFTDYYAVLGVRADASASEIKAAFKKLALLYHPDVNKSNDAQERMRVILQAYKILNDAAARKRYDAERIESGTSSYKPSYPEREQHSSAHNRSGNQTRAEVSPGARRDRQRYYAFPDFFAGRSVTVDLVDINYILSAVEGQQLLQQGMLRGIAPETERHSYYCHRCHYRWSATSRSRNSSRIWPHNCPNCKAVDWPEYLLLRCIHCCAIFESEQIRYEIGSYTYRGEHNDNRADALCPPYELFPLCPYCGNARWSPGEDARIQALQLRVTRQKISRILIIGISITVLVFAALWALGLL